MTQLPLHRRHIAGLLHNEHAHAMPGRVGSLVFIHPGKIPNLIPHRIDHPWGLNDRRHEGLWLEKETGHGLAISPDPLPSPVPGSR